MSKLFNNRIVARVADGNSVLVRVNYSRALIRFLGASCKASIQSGDDCVNSLTLFPEPGKRAIVALAVWNREKMPDDWTHAYLLDITWKGGNLPWLDLDEAWIPSGDQPAQASEWGVNVQINGITYSSCHIDADDQSATLRDVPDGNLLCRYLAGEATAEQVVAAAENLVEEMELLRTNSALRQQLAETDSRIGKLRYELTEMKQQLAEANSAFAQSQKELRDKCHEMVSAGELSANIIGKLQTTLRRIAGTANSACFGDRKKQLKHIIDLAS